jgi:hypothetical protein
MLKAPPRIEDGSQTRTILDTMMNIIETFLHRKIRQIDGLLA